ncbi:MAG TPA: hypothetical protein VFZ78_02860 [Flavisolibacter sp.]
MARVFTTPFEFNGVTYHALVSTHQSGDKTDFVIQLHDVDLHEHIPGGKFSYNSHEGLHQVELLEQEIARQLVTTITSSIDDHMQTMERVI